MYTRDASCRGPFTFDPAIYGKICVKVEGMRCGVSRTIAAITSIPAVIIPRGPYRSCNRELSSSSLVHCPPTGWIATTHVHFQRGDIMEEPGRILHGARAQWWPRFSGPFPCNNGDVWSWPLLEKESYVFLRLASGSYFYG